MRQLQTPHARAPFKFDKLKASSGGRITFPAVGTFVGFQSMVWEHLSPTKPHVAYAILACFAAFYALLSSFIKERLLLGQAVFASIYGLIVGPYCLKWFSPESWTENNFQLTFEISRILLCLDIFATVVELPKKYPKNHLWSILSLMVPTMTIGWLLIGVFVWLIIPHMKFTYGLLISATISATDPVLAAAVVGKGKFGRKIPSHVRNLLSAESGCNDGMAIPFVSLSLALILESGHHGAIAEEFLCVAFLYECIFGIILGSSIGFIGCKAAQFSKAHGLIDKESLIAFYFIIAIMCAGFGSILGTSDLLASFAAGTAFGWDGWAEDQEKGSDASVVLEILLNISYFVYLGAIMPWKEFVNSSLGLSIWRLIVLAIAVVFLRRLPGVLLIKPICPDIRNWHEAVFVGHMGPIGVGAVFAAVLAISNIEEHLEHIDIESPLADYPSPDSPEEVKLYYLIRVIWPIVCFLIIVSMLVHGSSPAIMMLAKHYNNFKFGMLPDATDEGSVSLDGDRNSIRSRMPNDKDMEKLLTEYQISDSDLQPIVDSDGTVRYPDRGYEDGNQLIIEDQYGEIMRTVANINTAQEDPEGRPSFPKRLIGSISGRSSSIPFVHRRTMPNIMNTITNTSQPAGSEAIEMAAMNVSSSPRSNSEPVVARTTTRASVGTTGRVSVHRAPSITGEEGHSNEPLSQDDPLASNALTVTRCRHDKLTITAQNGDVLGTYSENIRAGGNDDAFARAVRLMTMQKEMVQLEKKTKVLQEKIDALSNSIIEENEEKEKASGTTVRKRAHTKTKCEKTEKNRSS